MFCISAGAKYSKMKEQEVRAYHLEREKVEANMNQYIKACSKLKVQYTFSTCIRRKKKEKKQ
jgi:hypothetical protein